MKLFRLPKAFSAFFSQEKVTFWFSSQELLVVWGRQKKRFPLTNEAGFAHGQVSNFDQAVASLTQICEQEGIRTAAPLAFHTATVFVATGSSPLERRIVRQVFQKTGFQRVNLVSYATAIRAFAQRQAIRTGVGLYVGNDVGEGVVFTPTDQEGISFNHALISAGREIQFFLREDQKIEVSLETAQQLYTALGKKKEPGTYIVRGRDIQTQQIETKTMNIAAISKIRDFFAQKLIREVRPLMTLPLFTQANPNHWVIVGDALLNQIVQTEYQVNTVFLHSELELIQGVQWL